MLPNQYHLLSRIMNLIWLCKCCLSNVCPTHWWPTWSTVERIKKCHTDARLITIVIRELYINDPPMIPRNQICMPEVYPPKYTNFVKRSTTTQTVLCPLNDLSKPITKSIVVLSIEIFVHKIISKNTHYQKISLHHSHMSFPPPISHPHPQHSIHQTKMANHLNYTQKLCKTIKCR